MTISDPADTPGARLERLVGEHGAAVRAYAARRTAADGVDDVVAETFAVAWRRIADVRADAELPWLLGVARDGTLVTERYLDGTAPAVARLTARDPDGTCRPGVPRWRRWATRTRPARSSVPTCARSRPRCGASPRPSPRSSRRVRSSRR